MGIQNKAKKRKFSSIDEYKKYYYPDQSLENGDEHLDTDEFGKKLAKKHILIIRQTINDWLAKQS